MPDLTEHLEASAAFTKATGVAVEHGWRIDQRCIADHWDPQEEWGIGWSRTPNKQHDAMDQQPERVSINATDRDLSAWAWRQLEGIAKWGSLFVSPLRDGGIQVVCRKGTQGETVTGEGPDLASAVLAATKKIGGLA